MPQNEIAKDQKLVKRYRELEEKLHKFNTGEPMKIMQRWRDGHSVPYEIAIAPSANVQQSNDSANPVIGDYDILLKSNERAIPINGLDILGRAIVYRPNKRELQNAWAEVTGFLPDRGETVSDKIDRYLKKQTEPEKVDLESISGFRSLPVRRS